MAIEILTISTTCSLVVSVIIGWIIFQRWFLPALWRRDKAMDHWKATIKKK